MKYKVGDKVRIKSLDWYNENKDKDGTIIFSTESGDYNFIKEDTRFCGRVVTIVFEGKGHYLIAEDDRCYFWIDEMIEGLVEEETKPKYEDEVNGEYYSTTKYLVRPRGYQFVDENGNVINATKIVLEKKKKEYPKTYDECCKILGLNSEITDSELLFYYPQKCGDYTTIRLPEMEKFEKFIQLYLCRNAYWKISGEEMGLGKPWKPDWKNEDDKFIIQICNNKVGCWSVVSTQRILAFPTEEMRDAFKKNFDKDIEFCKELL